MLVLLYVLTLYELLGSCIQGVDNELPAQPVAVYLLAEPPTLFVSLVSPPYMSPFSLSFFHHFDF